MDNEQFLRLVRELGPNVDMLRVSGDGAVEVKFYPAPVVVPRTEVVSRPKLLGFPIAASLRPDSASLSEVPPEFRLDE
jgi:hypothetical protein